VANREDRALAGESKSVQDIVAASRTMLAEKLLTIPQRKLLAEVRKDGSRVYNGRARSRIEALEAAGLVTADWDMELLADGGTLWRITVEPKGDAR
jgi:hypothetical protein